MNLAQLNAKLAAAFYAAKTVPVISTFHRNYKMELTFQTALLFRIKMVKHPTVELFEVIEPQSSDKRNVHHIKHFKINTVFVSICIVLKSRCWIYGLNLNTTTAASIVLKNYVHPKLNIPSSI